LNSSPPVARLGRIHRAKAYVKNAGLKKDQFLKRVLNLKRLVKIYRFCLFSQTLLIRTFKQQKINRFVDF
jgi:hypothetical protein